MTQSFEEWRDSLDAKPGDKLLINDKHEMINFGWDNGQDWGCVKTSLEEPKSAKFLRRVKSLSSIPPEKLLPADGGFEVYECIYTWQAPKEEGRKHEFNSHSMTTDCKNCGIWDNGINTNSPCPGPKKKEEPKSEKRNMGCFDVPNAVLEKLKKKEEQGNITRKILVNEVGEYANFDTSRKPEKTEVEKFLEPLRAWRHDEFNTLKLLAEAIKADLRKEFGSPYPTPTYEQYKVLADQIDALSGEPDESKKKAGK